MVRRLFLACMAVLCTAPVWAVDTLLVAAGAGYRRPVLQLLEDFSQVSGIRAEASFGNMKQVETQARQNPDIALLIGDRTFLEPMGLVERFELLGKGRLVLVTRKGLELTRLENLREPRFGRIALPDRVKAVYGNAAATCLQRTGLAEPLAARLLEVATVPQVGAYVATGEVDAGFVNGPEGQALRGRIGALMEVPQECYAPIELSAGVIRGRSSAPAVHAFMEYLASPAARAVLQRHGM